MRTSQIVSTSVSNELYDLAKKHNIKWSEALRRGISLILSEEGVEGYTNKLNTERRLVDLINKLEKLQ